MFLKSLIGDLKLRKLYIQGTGCLCLWAYTKVGPEMLWNASNYWDFLWILEKKENNIYQQQHPPYCSCCRSHPTVSHRTPLEMPENLKRSHPNHEGVSSVDAKWTEHLWEEKLPGTAYDCRGPRTTQMEKEKWSERGISKAQNLFKFLCKNCECRYQK